MRIALPAADLARGLLAAVMVALLFSPPITGFLELCLYALMLGSADLRLRLARAIRQPLGVMALAFWAVVALGMAYSIAPWGEAFGIWWSWRRLLLLVIGLALFEDPAWKRRLALVLVGVASTLAIASFIGALLEIGYRHYPAGILLRNHAAQGMFFAVGAFAAVVLLLYERMRPSPWRVGMALAGLVLALNVVFITSSRSGHAILAILALAAAVGWPLPRAGALARGAIVLATTALLGAMLAASPIVRQRVSLAIDEYQRPAPGGMIVSSVGERVVYARNTLALIAERPILGYGTGAFRTAYARIVEGRTGLEGIKAHDPHNQYLNIAAQHGVLGLAVFLAVLVTAFGQKPAPPYRLLGLAVLAAWCATSLFSSHFSTFAEGRFVWLWLGVCLARD